jgi:hypothetical protein
MGVQDGGIDGVLVVVDRFIVEAAQPVTLKDIFRYTPVCLAVVEVADETMIVVGELVETDV